MDKDARRRPLKVVRVLCDGCERASAHVYCPDCTECACAACADLLHVRGRGGKPGVAARTCRGRRLTDLAKSVGVLALCVACRVRPAVRFGNGEVYGVCAECRMGHTPTPDVKPKGAGDIVKRAIAEEIGRKKRGRGKSRSSVLHSDTSKSKRGHDGDSTGDDGMDGGFSPGSSAE